MCIRDRSRDERIFIKYNKTRREQFQIKTCICEYLAPKDPDEEKRIREQKTGEAYELTWKRYVAVSYTHLDVYKRQYQGRADQDHCDRYVNGLCRDRYGALSPEYG